MRGLKLQIPVTDLPQAPYQSNLTQTPPILYPITSIMKLFEFEGVELFRREGIPVPDSALVSSPEEAQAKAKAIGLPVVLKAQVLTGGRWLAGGVEAVESLDDVLTAGRRILNSSIRGLPVRRLLRCVARLVMPA